MIREEFTNTTAEQIHLWEVPWNANGSTRQDSRNLTTRNYALQSYEFQLNSGEKISKSTSLSLVRSVAIAIIHFEEVIKAAINFVMMFVDIDWAG